MTPRLFPSRAALATLAGALALAPTVASAQFGAGGSNPMGPGAAPTAPPAEKEEGPAEKAPEEKGESPALQPLPAWPQQREKQLQFFQLNGYIRFRAYLFHNLNMGYFEQQTGPKSPFPIPVSEYGSTGQANPPAGTTNSPSSCAARNKSNCREDNLTSADMRLRLEPTVNVTEQVRVKAQLDIFDNMVMGTTPEAYFYNNTLARSAEARFPGLSRTQVAPEAGQNSFYSSIRAKRAWAEVRTPFGELRFGRMPDHWGTGMFVNNGDCLDCDFGTNADRVMFSTKLWKHFVAIMWDWVSDGPVTQNIGPRSLQGPYYNAEPLDDAEQWILALGRIDGHEEIKEKLDLGKVVFNYGARLAYRQQTWDYAPSTNISGAGNDPFALRDGLVNRNFRTFIGDLWLRLDWKKLHLEAEGAIIAGQIGTLQDIYSGVRGTVDVLSGGFVVKGNYKLLHDALKIYLEVGFASGDDSEDPNAVLNYRFANRIPAGNKMNRFTFDPDFHVDLILFRRILGAVDNATYLKPGVSYDIVDNFGARLDLIYALANRPVGYPGNATNLGLEIDAALMYKNEEEGFYAGLVYGVLFPFAALSFPANIYGTQFANDSGTAQTFQARLYVKF